MSTPTPPRQFAKLMVFMAIGHMVGIYATLAFLLFFPVPNENRELVSMMIGNIIGFLAGITAYHYSSNQDSAEKNRIIGVQAETAKAVAAAVPPAPVPDNTIQLEPGQAAQAPAADVPRETPAEGEAP